ncbi:MAG: AAA family ATPase [Desulfurella sp.]
MKVKKINSIRSFGQFTEFDWDENLSQFENYNFFYGWNCSGKTTLSRIFRSIEKRQLHKDYQNSTFSLELENNQKLTDKNIDNNYPIRVFNEDFIEDNFEWNNENTEIDPVLILGEESKELDKQLKQKEKEKKETEKQKNNNENEKNQKERDLQNKLTIKASEIRNILSITNPKEFDKNALEEKIEQIKENFSEKILSDNKLENLRDVIASQKLNLISLSMTLDFKLGQYINDIKKILNNKVTAQKIIEKLNQNTRLSEWVKEGIDLHKNEDTCQFCGNSLTKERLDELNKHFSEEFNLLMKEIDEKEAELNHHIEYINQISFPDKARLYNEFQQDYEDLLNRFNEMKIQYINTVKSLIKELKRKKGKPFETITIDQSINEDIEKEIINLFAEIKKIIKQQNNKVNSLAKEKEDAKEKIKLHYCAKFIQDEKYFELKNEITQLDEKIKNLEQKINNITEEIKEIEQKIKASAIGAKKLNEYLNNFFGDDRFKIEQTENGRYKLYRNDQIAKNLSTGERNIISLIYFFSKLEETNFDLGNSVIFIDDPVSSLDSNHMHKVYAFLCNKVKKIGQLFITTHNYDFFNLIKDLYKYGLGNKNGKFYLIKRIENKNQCYSTIEVLPDLLMKFKSEYNYLFSLLKEFNDTQDKDKNSFEQLYLIPNILRRFFEMYLFMRYPNGKKFKEKANDFFTNISNINGVENMKIMALKLMDEYSHEENPTYANNFPELPEIINSVSFILTCIKEKDSAHFVALESSV